MKIGQYTIEITHPDKIWFPKSKILKQDIVQYYATIAPFMLPYMKNHLLNMQRFPDGITGESFYHKNAPDYFPDWIKREPVHKKEGGIVHYVVCDNAATLVYLANFGCLTPHLWLSKIDKLDYPEYMIFDLDPSNKNDFISVKNAAFKIKESLEAHDLIPFVKTTGSRGVHVVVPLKRTATFDEVRAYALHIAQHLVEQDPQHFTLEMRKKERKGRVFIDILRNAFSATAVAPYAVRAHEYAPVATPVTWEELDVIRSSQDITINNVFKLLDKRGNVWENFLASAQALKKVEFTK